MTILERIDELRIQRGWSVNYLAMEAMLTQSTVNNLYVRKSEPKLSTLRAICDAFGITLANFFAGMEDNADDEYSKIIQLICSLSEEQKKAVYTILRSIKSQ